MAHEERKNTNRVEKASSLLQHLLGQILVPYLKNQPAISTVSKVIVSGDMRWAKIYISIVTISADEEVQHAMDQRILTTLKNKIYEIQGELNRTINMKLVPRISFHLDTSARQAEYISSLFKEIDEEREAGKQP